MPIQVPVVQTGLEQSIQQAAAKAGKNLRINMGPGAKSIESLSKPLGRLTGKADEFTKSMEAANARVLAFGASVGVIAAVSRGLQELVKTTIEVEKSLTNINSILKQSESQLDSFKNQIFDIARNTGQTFDTVAEAALELSRQGLKAEEVTKRLNDALVLSRLSGLSAADSVAGLTAAVNSFSSAGLTTTEVLNKISAAAASAAVSDRDLIEGLKRSGAVAVASGVQFDELIGIISALQERTARGGAVIGNSLKTIFTRIQDLDKLQSLQKLGVEVTDLEGKVLSSNKIIENLAPTFAKLDQASKVNLADNLVGKFQIAPFLALLEDYNLKVSRSGEVAATSFNATNEAYQRNEALSKTLANAVNVATVNLKELANTLGEIGVTDSLKNIIGVFNSIVSSIQDVLDGDGIGSQFAKGLIKGISTIISGPGLALALVAIGKLLLDFAKFGAGALKTFFGLNKAAEAQKNLQGQIAASLLNDKGIRSAILSIEKQNISEGEKKKLQTQFFTKALNEQLMVMQKMQGIARTIAPGVMAGTASRRGKRAAGGFLPIGAESSDISRGVGGAPASAKPVVIPNFAFGGGKRGTMVANDSEYIVPNYANGGDAIFNQNMASSIGLPANARRVRAASGYIPNFATVSDLLKRPENFIKPDGSFTSNSARDAYNKSTGENRKKIDAYRNRNKGKRSYMANQQPNKSIMLIPQPNEFGMNLSDHKFLNPYKSARNGLIDFFEGPAVGISKKLKKGTSAGNKFSKLLTLDEDIQKAIAKGVNTVFSDFKDASGNPNVFKTKPNQITASNVKDIMEKGGPGALGAIKGATFEALMQAIVGGVAQKGGELDVDFSKDKGNILDLIFGIEGKNFKFGDFKSSLDSKDKFARQVIDNVKGKVITGAKTKTVNSKTAASGYIPNFAEGALEDAIGREKAAGLPVSQIRINQSGKLRNAQNPMGLAVTNTRDEPTGAIPNYAKVDTGQAVDGLTNKLFALQSVMFLFQSGVGEMAEESSGVAKVMLEVSQAATQAVMALTALQAFGGIGSIFGKLRGGLGKIGGKGAEIMARGSGRMAAGRTLMGAGARAGSTGILGKGALTTLRGGLLKAGGALLRFAGPVGIAATAATLLAKGFTMGYDKFFGTADSIETAGKLIENSAKRAAEELNKLKVDENVKKDLKAQSSGIANQLTIEFLKDVELEGYSDEEQVENIKKSMEQLLLRGGDTSDLKFRLQNLTANRNRKSGFGGQFAVPQEMIDDFIAENTTKGKSLQKRLSSFKGGITDKQVQDELEFRRLGSKIQKEGGISVEEARKRGSIRGDFLKSAKNADISSVLALAALEQKINEAAEKRTKIDSINLANAKARLETAIEIRKENLKTLTDTDKQIMRAEALGGIDDNALLALKQKAEQQKLLNDLASKNLDFIGEQREELTRLKLGKRQIEDIEKEILNISTEDLAKKDQILRIVDKIYKTNGLTDEVGKSLMESLRIQLDRNEGIFEASSKTLKNRQDETAELTKQKQLIKEIEAERALTAQTIQFGKKNVSAEERSRIQAQLRSLGRRKEEANQLGQQGRVQDLNNQIAALQQSLARISGGEGQTGIDARARTIDFPKSIQNMFPDKISTLKDPNVDAMQTVRDITREAFNIIGIGVVEEEYNRFKKTVNDLEQEIQENTRAEKDGVDAAKNQELSLSELAKINETLAKNVAPFSESESASASRLAIAQRIVEEDPTKSLPLEIRRLEMERGVSDRFKEIIPTALESSDKLRQTLAEGSLDFAYNIGNAMLDAIQKGENLGDVLLGTAAEFLNLISRAFMKSAVDDILGSFGVGKQGGGPISGGSGTKDDVPAMLMGGEFVMNKKAVRKYGMGFMSALNNGSLQGFASGGQVKDREGMFTTPGMNGAGAIKGAANLLSFATQTPVALNRDTITSSGAFLDAESGRMTMFGRRNNPQFQKVQDAKRQAFDLYASEMNARQQAKEQEKANKKALMDSLKGAAISAVVGVGMKSMAAGFKAGFSGTEGSFGAKLGAGLKGTIFGGNDIAGQSYGGLSNLFTGRGFQSGPSGLGSGFTPKSASAIPSGNSAPLLDLYEGARLGGKITMLPKRAATGGLIPAAGGVDTVPAMLSGGEFVMNAAATRNIGAGNLQALNSGAGVDNTDLVSKLDELILATEASQSTGEINITVNGSNGTDTQTSGQDTTDQQRQLSERIKVAVKQVIADEQRLGGQLRR
jgi:TP901 family phage tail tape measure protein